MPNGKEIVIKGQRQTHKFLNIAQAKQLLRKDSKAYLAYVVGTKREAPIGSRNGTDDFVVPMPRGFSRGSQGRVPVPSVSVSSEVVVLDPNGIVNRGVEWWKMVSVLVGGVVDMDGLIGLLVDCWCRLESGWKMPPKKSTQSKENSSSLAEGPVINEILDLLHQQQQQQLQLIQQVQQQQHQQGELNQTTRFKSFQSVKPPEFKGEVNHVVARNWLKEMEKAFTLMQVNDDLKTDYASYFLKNEANYWWESTRALEGEGPVSWTRFTELFLEKHFPDGLRNQLEVEFLELKQGERSVLEYEAKFTELARLVPEYAALVVESDQKLVVKEESDKKRKLEGVMNKADQGGSSEEFENRFGRNRGKGFWRQSLFQARSSAISIVSTPALSVKSAVDCKSRDRRHSGS
ncbi:hypothetical protein AgCh_000906 [Apium graveolens]